MLIVMYNISIHNTGHDRVAKKFPMILRVSEKNIVKIIRFRNLFLLQDQSRPIGA